MIRAVFLILLAAATSCVPDKQEDTGPLIGASAVEAQQKTCEAAGGRFGKAGIAGTRVCYRTPPDAGKACNRATDCTSECLARTKTCAPITPLFGCNDILDSLGRSVTLCRD